MGSESKLRREFEVYGTVRKISLVHDDKKSSKPRGYAFIEYEHERDMHSAYKHTDGKKIDGRRVLVDVERARTVKGWLPRRLGGGLGGTRRGGPEVNVKHSGREDNERERQRYLDRERERERGGGGGGGGGGPDRGRDRERERDRDRGDKRRSRSRDRERRKRSRSRDRKRVRRSEERLDVSIATSENNFAVTSGDERKRDKDRDTKDKDRRERRDRDKDRGKDREGKDKDRERKRSRRSRSRDRRDKDKERESRRDYPREDGVEPVRVKEEPPDEYENYPAQEEYEEYNNYDPENIKYESEGGEAHFQNEEKKKCLNSSDWSYS